MKNKGFALYELLISISFLSIILISMFSIMYSLSTKLHDVYMNNEINDKKAIIYKKLASDFAKNHISYQKNDNNNYTFALTNYETNAITTKKLIYDSQNNQLRYGTENSGKMDSNSIINLDSETISIDSIVVSSVESGINNSDFVNSENYKYFLVLTIRFKYNDKTSDMKIYCVNENKEI